MRQYQGVCSQLICYQTVSQSSGWQRIYRPRLKDTGFPIAAQYLLDEFQADVDDKQQLF
jgi:hypothetical protein